MFRFLVPAVLLAATPVFADPATPDDARALETTLRRYAGPTEGVVTVTPEVDRYKVVLDPTGYARMLPPDQGNLQVSPLTLTLTDQGGGKWQVDADQPMTLKVGAPIETSADGKVPVNGNDLSGMGK